MPGKPCLECWLVTCSAFAGPFTCSPETGQRRPRSFRGTCTFTRVKLCALCARCLPGACTGCAGRPQPRQVRATRHELQASGSTALIEAPESIPAGFPTQVRRVREDGSCYDMLRRYATHDSKLRSSSMTFHPFLSARRSSRLVTSRQADWLGLFESQHSRISKRLNMTKPSADTCIA